MLADSQPRALTSEATMLFIHYLDASTSIELADSPGILFHLDVSYSKNLNPLQADVQMK